MKLIKAVTTGLAATLASRGFAHDGDHGAGLATNLWHVLTEPEHRFALLALGVMLAAALALRHGIVRARAQREETR